MSTQTVQPRPLLKTSTKDANMHSEPGWIRRITREVLPPVALLVVVLALWQLASNAELISRIVLPGPIAIAKATGTLLSTPFFYDHFGTTLAETGIGYGLGVGGGFLLGVLTALVPLARRIIVPYAVLIESLPKIILAPLTLIWFGYGIASKVALIVLIVFFPVYLNTMTGLANSSEEEHWLLRTSRASRWQTFTYLMLPNALPNVFVGVKNGLVGAFIGAIVSEFIGARAGLGVLVKTYNEQLRIDYVYAVVVIMAALSLLFYLTLEYVDRRVVFWRSK